MYIILGNVTLTLRLLVSLMKKKPLKNLTLNNFKSESRSENQNRHTSQNEVAYSPKMLYLNAM